MLQAPLNIQFKARLQCKSKALLQPCCLVRKGPVNKERTKRKVYIELVFPVVGSYVLTVMARYAANTGSIIRLPFQEVTQFYIKADRGLDLQKDHVVGFLAHSVHAETSNIINQFEIVEPVAGVFHYEEPFDVCINAPMWVEKMWIVNNMNIKELDRKLAREARPNNVRARGRDKGHSNRVKTAEEMEEEERERGGEVNGNGSKGGSGGGSGKLTALRGAKLKRRESRLGISRRKSAVSVKGKLPSVQLSKLPEIAEGLNVSVGGDDMQGDTDEEPLVVNADEGNPMNEIDRRNNRRGRKRRVAVIDSESIKSKSIHSFSGKFQIQSGFPDIRVYFTGEIPTTDPLNGKKKGKDKDTEEGKVGKSQPMFATSTSSPKNKGKKTNKSLGSGAHAQLLYVFRASQREPLLHKHGRFLVDYTGAFIKQQVRHRMLSVRRGHVILETQTSSLYKIRLCFFHGWSHPRRVEYPIKCKITSKRNAVTLRGDVSIWEIVIEFPEAGQFQIQGHLSPVDGGMHGGKNTSASSPSGRGMATGVVTSNLGLRGMGSSASKEKRKSKERDHLLDKSCFGFAYDILVKI